ncbi:MAG TPA: hypothetical protein VM638_07185 [Actinomycetota bacterium]|nr:hypothetical protein [Actinomycetota bacterium]
MDDASDLQQLTIDYLLLADGAQVQNGKLYVLGGGWERLQFDSYPQTVPVGIALGVRVPWGETNQKHSFRIRGLDADGQELFGGQGEFEMGRPAGLPLGTSQIFQVALQLPLPVPAPGQYSVEADVDGAVRRSTPYFAVQTRPG